MPQYEITDKHIKFSFIQIMYLCLDNLQSQVPTVYFTVFVKVDSVASIPLTWRYDIKIV
jgi:hypothetical protein